KRRYAPLLRVAEPEAPVRPSSFLVEARTGRVIELQGGAAVERRHADRELALAPAIQLLLRLVARIEAPFGLQLLGRLLVACDPRRLALLAIPLEAEPFEIRPYRLGERRCRSLRIGIVKAEPQRAAVPVRKEPV